MTVVFADLVGFTSRAESLDPEDVQAILGPYHARLRHELERHGGTVEKFIGDAVVAVFGAPVAHEDDAERAVRAALAIRDWARDEEDVEVRIGVNTGEALVSVDARPDAGEGMVAGDVVNTAARLQSAAPVNGDPRRRDDLPRDRARRSTTPRPSRSSAKGKAEPVPVWEAVAARARVGVDLAPSRVALVGRARELDAPRAARSRACARSTRRSSSRSSASRGSARAGSSASSSTSSRRSGADQLAAGPLAARTARASATGRSPRWSRPQAGILESDDSEEVEAKLARAVGRRGRRRATAGGSRRISARSSGSAGRRAPWRHARGGVRRLAPLLRGARATARPRCSYSKTCTGPTTACSTSSTTSSSGRPASRCCSSAPRGPSCSPAGRAGAAASCNATTVSLSPLSRRRDGAARPLAARPGRPAGRGAGDAAGARRRKPALRRGVRARSPRSAARRRRAAAAGVVQGLIAARIDALAAEREGGCSSTPPSSARSSGRARSPRWAAATAGRSTRRCTR